MSETISKHIGEGFGKGELYAALAYDAGDAFGGMKIKNVMFDTTGKAYFYDSGMYIGASADGALVIASDTSITLEAPTVNVSVTASSAFTDPVTITLTDPATTVNGLYSLIDAGVTWTGGNIVAVRGKVAVNGAGNNIVSATGVWAGLDFADAIGLGTGLTCAINAEVSSDNATCPNAIVYIQSLPGSGANFANVPYLVFSETAAGTGSNILFEVGHAPAATVPTLTSGTLFYHDTLQIAVNKTAGNRTAYFIPLSTAQGSFTTAYPIVTTYATTAISIATCTTGISIVAPTTGISLTGQMTTGISMPGALTYIPIQIGVKSADNVTPGEGMKLAGLTDNSGGIQIYCDDGGVAAVGEVISPFRSRYLLTANQSGGVSQTALFAQLVSGGTGTRTYTTGAFRAAYIFNQQGTTTLVTSAECLGINQATTLAGTMTVGVGCTFAGIDINIAGAGAISNSGTAAGLLIRASGTPVWPVGVQIPDGDTLTGISIGSCATAGINIEGTHTLALGIGSTTALTTATTAMSAVKVQSAFSATSGYHVGAWFVGNYTGAGAAGGSVYALRGHAAVTGTQTTVGTAAYIVGVHGRCAVTGTAYNSSAIYAGVLAQMLAGGTWTAANLVYCLWVDNQLATNPTAGTVAMVGIRQNNNSATAVVDHCFDIYGPRIDNFINFDTCTGTGAFITDNAATGSVKKAKCKIGDTDYYINMYELS